MDSIASASVKCGSINTQKLLFRPFDLKFWLQSALYIHSKDPRDAEMLRLRNYYRGTRLLAFLGILSILPMFLVPFTEPFIGMEGVILLLAAYMALLVFCGLVGMLLEVSLDPVFAFAYEMKIGLPEAIRMFIDFARKDPISAIGYMGTKLVIDMITMTLVTAFYLPALLAMILILLSVINTLQAGQMVSRSMAIESLALVAFLWIAAVFATRLVSVPLAAFYGYYTEEAVRRIRKS